MNTEQMALEPMTNDQLEYIKSEIKKTYLYLISHTNHDPMVVEIMKLSALADVQRRYEAGEPWQ
ncbi:MAG: hypothetical protein QNJ58_25620 [Desulfobacterales bacterium]|nr:hypothetical protein [Desulfobacterales bacterium]